MSATTTYAIRDGGVWGITTDADEAARASDEGAYVTAVARRER